MGIIGDIFGFIATPLYYAISGILIGWHKLFEMLGLDPAGGMSWVLSIVGLTLVIRALLIPLFVKQIKASRNMQLIQPKVKELQKKYGHCIIKAHLPPPGTPTQPIEAGYRANGWLFLRHPDFDELRRIMDEFGRGIKVWAE